jgi:glycolate oxidase iron-sulfur subunit
MTESLSEVLKHEEQKILACVHCGLCLEACPTYTLTNNENDSPRGRIYLMRAVEEGRLESSSRIFSRHINRCLGCRACEAACPAGVEYGHLLEAARTDIKQTNKKKTLSEKLLRFVLRNIWLKPSRLKFAFTLSRLMRDLKLPKLLLKTKLARLFSKRFEFALSLLDSSSPIEFEKRENNKSAIGNRQSAMTTVLFFRGCVMDGLFARVNQATVRALQVNECSVEIPQMQVCCGALHAHAGDIEGAKELARKNIDAFSETIGPIITNAGGCGAMLLTYADLFADDKRLSAKADNFSRRVRDVSQHLKETGIKKGAKIDERVTTYDASCHLHYGQHASEASLEMLQAIPDLKFVALEGSERCCGGAGVYNLMQPEMSSGVLKEKLDHIKETGAEILATGNPGCQMQIAVGARLNGFDLCVCHPVELLDQSYRCAGFYAESDKLP